MSTRLPFALPGLRAILLMLGLLASGLLSAQIIPAERIDIDSTRNDSLAPPEDTEIDPDTRLVFPEMMFSHRPAVQKADFEMSQLPHFDLMEREEGFTQTLGQVGKFYQNSRYGFNDRMFQHNRWRNPLYGRYNPYVTDPGFQVPYYDTRTNYVALNYVQGSRRLQLIDGILSRNFTPEINFTGYYQNRRSDGAYRFHTTNHRVLAGALYYRSRNRRYHAFLNGTFSELTDEVNGGMLRTRGSGTSETFLKELETPLLREAEHKRIVRGFHLDQQYHLLGPPPMTPNPRVRRDTTQQDSVAGDSTSTDTVIQATVDSTLGFGRRPSPHRLSLRFLAAIEDADQDFEDKEIDVDRIFSSFYNPLPTLNPDTNAMAEAMNVTAIKIRGSGSYSFFKPGLFFNIQAALGLESRVFKKDTARWFDDRAEQWAKGNFFIEGLNLDLGVELRRTSSSLFDAETYAFAEMDLHPRLRKRRPTPFPTAEDSIKHDGPVVLITPDPVTLSFVALFSDQNPSFFQRFYPASKGNLYQANPDLLNQQLIHFRAGIRLEGNRRDVLNDTTFANFLKVDAFLSTSSRFIYYSPQFEVLQAGQGQDVTWIGLEIGARLRLFGKIYFEAEAVLQQGSTGDQQGLEYYGEHLPGFYTKSSFYYDNRNISFAGRLRIGVDFYYFNAYRSLGMDAASGEFFPSNYYVQPYPRFDFYFSTQIKRAFVWIKLINLTEYLFAPGYYTTPFYPELERTFAFGVNWTFFD